MQAPHGRRDLLLDIQRRAQQKWAQHRVFESDAPHDGEAAARQQHPQRTTDWGFAVLLCPGIKTHLPAARQLSFHCPPGVVLRRVKRVSTTILSTAVASSVENKFFGTFPYPYMNGLLHLGHAFSLSKVRMPCQASRCAKRDISIPKAP